MFGGVYQTPELMAAQAAGRDAALYDAELTRHNLSEVAEKAAQPAVAYLREHGLSLFNGDTDRATLVADAYFDGFYCAVQARDKEQDAVRARFEMALTAGQS